MYAGALCRPRLDTVQWNFLIIHIKVIPGSPKTRFLILGQFFKAELNSRFHSPGNTISKFMSYM